MMSFTYECSFGWILDHLNFVRHTYSSVNIGTHASSQEKVVWKGFSYNDNIFKILNPFCFDSEAVRMVQCKNKKRKFPEDNGIECSEMAYVKLNLEQLIASAKKRGLFNFKAMDEELQKNNEEARNSSQLYFTDICKNKLENCSGGNTADSPVLVNVNKESYLIPGKCLFFNCDIQSLRLPDNSKYDFVLLDPPWWNKYVRRKRSKQETGGYKMMYNEEVCSLPIGSWLADNALVAVWCTNCARHIQDVVTKWFPTWGINHVATWYWVKVTRSGEAVCKFSTPPGKQPYERVLFGAVQNPKRNLPPDKRIIVSVPSAIHSHKPPLCELMKPFLPLEPRSLELFARYLLPNYTSVGDQVLTLQNVELFTEVKEDVT